MDTLIGNAVDPLLRLGVFQGLKTGPDEVSRSPFLRFLYAPSPTLSPVLTHDCRD